MSRCWIYGLPTEPHPCLSACLRCRQVCKSSPTCWPGDRSPLGLRGQPHPGALDCGHSTSLSRLRQPGSRAAVAAPAGQLSHRALKAMDKISPQQQPQHSHGQQRLKAVTKRRNTEVGSPPAPARPPRRARAHLACTHPHAPVAGDIAGDGDLHCCPAALPARRRRLQSGAPRPGPLPWREGRPSTPAPTAPPGISAAPCPRGKPKG